MVDGFGTVTGMVENYANATALASMIAGHPEVAGPAMAVGTVAGRLSSGADYAGLMVEISLVVSGSEYGSRRDILSRGVSVVVNQSHIHARHEQLEMILISLGINFVDQAVNRTGEDGRKED